jgi:hypothetical protein
MQLDERNYLKAIITKQVFFYFLYIQLTTGASVTLKNALKLKKPGM